MFYILYLPQVEFHVLIFGDDCIDEVYIHIDPDTVKPLDVVDSRSNLWRCTAILPSDLFADPVKYKYSFISSRTKDAFSAVMNKLFKNNSTASITERVPKCLGSQATYDVFHFPEDKEYISETVPKSIIFYLNWLLQSVDCRTITDTLSKIEKFRFITFSPKHVRELVNWLVKLAADCNITEVQGLYLSIVLSHVFTKLTSPYVLPKDPKTTVACDRLLQYLDACLDSVFLSQPNREHLKKIAIILVQHSSNPCSLALAAHFYPYLGVKFVLEPVHDAVGLTFRCENTLEYRKMVDALFSAVNITNDRFAFMDLLYFVLERAPTLIVALQLFESSNVCRLFPNEDERVQIFVQFYKSAMRSGGTNKQPGSICGELPEFYNIPEKLRGRMHKLLFQILLEYAMSDDELDDEHEKTFVNSIISDHILHNDQVLDILMQLSKSKSVRHQNLLIEILNSPRFQKCWHETSLPSKTEICKSWVITTVVNKKRINSLDDVSKVEAAYEAIDTIMKCSLNSPNKDLAKHVSESIASSILRGKELVSIILAYVRVAKCSEIVQKCYKSHVKKKLARAQKPEKIKCTLLLKECSGSRYTGF